ncbi:MAG TPA: 3-methyl-2-oxobutanoate hydroxymethyltransferase [Phycisphaerae bacterium]|nr:3-methyl-2-oxobutanoate hydroxymethyltransferase [Phycisphaerae bacterium]
MAEQPTRRTTLASLRAGKKAGRKFSVLTCYDAATARLMAAAGVEVLLVGDTAGEVVLGLPTTRQVPIDFLLTLTAAVRRGAPNSFLMADLPYLCRVEGPDATIEWCRRFHRETDCDAVKIEVTARDVELVTAVRRAGVPVVAHLGLLPQSIESREGYRAQARDADSALKLIADARTLIEAGADMLLLEAVSSEVAREITAGTEHPVIGCVAGPHCDGTVVVLHDLVGWGGGHPPRAVRRYADLAEVFAGAFAGYVADVQAGRFPTEEDAIHMRPGEHERLKDALRSTSR